MGDIEATLSNTVPNSIGSARIYSKEEKIMNKYYFVLVMIVFICFYSNNSYAGLIDKIISEIQKTTKRDSIKRDTKSNTTSNLKYVDLHQGMYGIPFGATIEEVTQWCKENNMLIDHPTRSGVEEDTKYAVTRELGGLSESTYYEDIARGEAEIQKMSLLEVKELLKKLANGEGSPYYFIDLRPKEILKEFDIFNNPSIIFNNNEYFLSSIFTQRQMEIIIEGKVKEVFYYDENLIENYYQLNVRPSKTTSDMLGDGIEEIRIKFYKGKDQQLKSFSALARFRKEDFDSLTNILNEKYGHFDITWVDDTLLSEIKILTTNSGSPIHGDELVWRRNVIMFIIGTISGTGTILGTRFEPNTSYFHMLYYEPNLAKEVFNEYNMAIKRLEDNYYQEKEGIKEKMKTNF